MTAGRAVVLLAVVLALPASLHAQQPPVIPGSAATVATAAPVFLRPDATRTPLRTLAINTPLVVEQQQGDWLQVTWEDPALGRRTGWIEMRFVRVSSGPARTLPEPRDTPGATPPPRDPPAARQPAPRRTSTAPPPGFRVFGRAAWDRMSATESFEAVTGSATVPFYGGGVQLTNLWRGLFIEASIERAKVDGERVFATRDEVFPLGIPVAITMLPIDVVAGWRVTTGRLGTFAGGGVTSFGYKETSEFAEEDEDLDDRYTGFVLMGGVEVSVMRWVHVRGDLRYRQVRDVLGVGGVSEVFGEDRLGGFGAGVSLVIGR